MSEGSGSFVSGFIAFLIGVLLCCGVGSVIWLCYDDFVSLDYGDVDVGPVYEPIGLVSGESNWWLIVCPLIVVGILLIVLLLLPDKVNEDGDVD